jgi:hypothetical protein
MSARFCATAALGLCLAAGCSRFQAFEPALSGRTDLNPGMIPGLTGQPGSTEGSAGETLPIVSPASLPAMTAAGPTPDELNQIVAELNLGHAEARANNLEGAKRHYRRVLELQADQPEAHHRLAIIADKEQDFGAAEHHYLTALRKSTGNADLLSDLGYSYFLQRRYRESLGALEQALQINPSHGRALNNLGLLCGTQGDYDAALAMFRRAGSEMEAQNKIAKLFPTGRPQAAPQPVNPNYAGEELLAAGAPVQAAPSAATQTPPALPDAMNVQPNQPTDLTLQIKEQMELARRYGIAERQQEKIESRQPLPTNGTGPVPRVRVPDGDINQMLAAIDAGSRPQMPAMATPASPVWNSPSPALAAMPSMQPMPMPQMAPNQANYATAPQAAQPTWPTGTQTAAIPNTPETAHYQQPTAPGVRPPYAIQPSSYQTPPAPSVQQPMRSLAEASYGQAPGQRPPQQTFAGYRSAPPAPPAAVNVADANASRTAAVIAMDGGMFPVVQSPAPQVSAQQAPAPVPSAAVWPSGAAIPGAPPTEMPAAPMNPAPLSQPLAQPMPMQAQPMPAQTQPMPMQAQPMPVHAQALPAAIPVSSQTWNAPPAGQPVQAAGYPMMNPGAAQSPPAQPAAIVQPLPWIRPRTSVQPSPQPIVGG